MRTQKQLLAFAVIVLMVALVGGCLFGGGAKDDVSGEPGDLAPPEPGDMPPPEMPGEPGDMLPPEMPGDPGAMPPPDMPGEPGVMPSAAGGSAAKALQLKHQGSYDQAAAEYRAVLQADPDNADANWGLAWILAEQGLNEPPKRQEARTFFEKFLALADDAARKAEAEAALKRIK
ncbi:MAG: tetratricopeptide repeat protein [candidate division WS1 bacterium]|nr:tetratricopeptide repeat protein [candidate division WS1 bacterium]